MSERIFKPEQEVATKKTVQQAQEMPAPAQPDVVSLQGVIGNRAVQRLLASGHTIQAKMVVTDSNDQYEAQADQVADQVMRMSEAPLQREGDEEELQAMRIQREGDEEELQAMRIQREDDEEELQAMRIQRKDDEEELQAMRIQREDDEEELQAMRIQREDDEEEPLQAASVDMRRSFQVGGDIEEGIQDARGGGQPMDGETRDFFESRMGADFSGVRVHSGPDAAQISRSIGAKAFTTGSDIFFGEGHYNPGSDEGKRLMAHELTHVVQQGAAQIKRKPDES